MAYDTQEQEHLATLKDWWDRYGSIVLAAVTVALLAFAAWNGLRWYERREAVAASAIYEQVSAALAAGDQARLREHAGTLMREHGGTVFAAMAALHSARSSIEGRDLAAARAQFEWVINESGRDEFVAIARLRLAGVLLDENNHAEALRVLASAVPPEHRVAFADRRGDVLYAQGRKDEARAAWQQALDQAEPQHPLRPLIQLKLDALPAQAAT